jgi:hypothetical protein
MDGWLSWFDKQNFLIRGIIIRNYVFSNLALGSLDSQLTGSGESDDDSLGVKECRWLCSTSRAMILYLFLLLYMYLLGIYTLRVSLWFSFQTDLWVWRERGGSSLASIPLSHQPVCEMRAQGTPVTSSHGPLGCLCHRNPTLRTPALAAAAAAAVWGWTGSGESRNAKSPGLESRKIGWSLCQVSTTSLSVPGIDLFCWHVDLGSRAKCKNESWGVGVWSTLQFDMWKWRELALREENGQLSRS